jgi:hypothetical protein
MKIVLFTLIMVSLAVAASLDGEWVVAFALLTGVVLVNARLVFERGAALVSVEACMVKLRENFNAVLVEPPEPSALGDEEERSSLDSQCVSRSADR